MSESSNKTYVHDGLEVRLTGRKAKKEPRENGTRLRAGQKTSTIHEITPTDAETGSWKKWVKMTDLFEIVAE
jgi:hypothetical protein